jgi:diguanylate cyclase (GGDEF)-like protein
VSLSLAHAPAIDSRVMLSRERVGYLQILRIAFCLIAIASALFTPEVMGVRVSEFAAPTAIYLIGIGIFEVIRKSRFSGNLVNATMLVADGLYLAWVTYASGADQSPLRFLLYMHVIAVTLLVSHKAGVRIAWWHSLLIFFVFHAQLVELIAPQGVTMRELRQAGLEVYQPSLFNAIALWLVALGTAPFSSLNERELRRRKGDLEVLADTARDFENTGTAPEVAKVLVDRVCAAFGFRRGFVLAGAADKLDLMASHGCGTDGELRSFAVHAAVKQAWEKRDTLLLSRPDEDDQILQTLLPEGRNILVAPLIADGQPLGVLVVENDEEDAFIQRRIVSMVGQFASHGALAMRNAWLLEQVQRLAATDALTGVANRRTFEKVLQAEISRAARGRSDVSLIMLDIDRFKSLNDQFGHQAGDEVLAQVGEALASACRESDTPARYGGEEFAVLMPACSPEEAVLAAERLRKRISEIDTVREITFSAGIATFPIHALSPEDLIARADDALYRSKRTGRNRVSLCERSLTEALPISSSNKDV